MLRMSGTFYVRSELTAPWGLTCRPTRIAVVPRRERRRRLARGRRRRAPLPAARRLRPRAPRRGPPAAQRPGRPRPGSTRCPTTTPATATRSCGTAAVGRRRASCAAPSASGTRRPATWWRCCRGRSSSRSPARRRRPRPSGCRARSGSSPPRRRAAPGRRGGDHPAVGHPGHPGHPGVDRRRPGGPDRLAGSAAGPRIGRAMSLVHRDPAQPWSVASLARATAMSRSAFAARFTELVGEPVMRYVTRWRMQVALDWLQHDDVPGRRAGRPPGLRVRGGVQPRLQAHGRHASMSLGSAPTPTTV